MPTLTLSGCAPVPLAHYLKALGILRLVSEQADPAATGRWHRDQFVLNSKLDREALLKFFLEEYEPTPILSPWNGDGGFFVGSRPGARKALSDIEISAAPRLANYRRAISEIRSVLSRFGIIEKPKDEEKGRLISICRNHLDERVLQWLDATSVITGDGTKHPPLLGTGGNDGSSDFSKNWMLVLPAIFALKDGHPARAALLSIESSFFRSPVASPPLDAPIGQFLPGMAGGANITSGFKGEPMVNPWDFILMIEGALIFAAASVKRLESTESGVLAYPFCVRQSNAGYSSVSLNDDDHKRPTEMWLPLWSGPVTLAELSAIFAEGRAQVGNRPAKNGIDFARAVTSLGVDRGLDEFQRYGFQVRNGLSYFATPLTRIVARKNAGVDLLSDIDTWLTRFRSAATKDTAPASARRALSQLESAIVDLCISHSPERLLRVFIALGQCQATAARSLKWASKPETYLPPLQGLRRDWLDQLPPSRELRLAASLASLTQSFGKKWLPFRCHLEAVEPKPYGYAWAENPTNDVQWSQAPLIAVLNNIFSRRLLKKPDEDKLSAIPAELADIKAFIEAQTDDDLLSDLLWSMSLIDWREKTDLRRTAGERQPVPPTFYALLRLCFPPARSILPEAIRPVPAVPAIHRLAANGSGAQAAAQALRRLRASVYQPKIKELPVHGQQASRTAAALLFPVSTSTLEALLNQITLPEKEPSEDTPAVSL